MYYVTYKNNQASGIDGALVIGSMSASLSRHFTSLRVDCQGKAQMKGYVEMPWR